MYPSQPLHAFVDRSEIFTDSPNKGGAEEKECDIDKSGGGIGKNFTPVNKGGAEEKDTVNVVATQRIMVQKPWLPLTDAFTRHVSRNSKHF